MPVIKANPTARRSALLQERDRLKIETIGVRVTNRIAVEMNARILTAFERGQNIIPVITERLDSEFTPLIQRAMVAGHLQGRLRTARVAAVRFQKRRTLSAYDEALGWLRKRMALTPEQMQALMEAYGNEAARVTRGLNDAVEQRVQDAMEKIIAGGEHTRDAIATLREELVSSGSGPMSPPLMETLVRTQTQMAYSAGRWNGNQDEAIQDILWGYEYVTVGDDRVRPAHQAQDGVRMPKDAPYWQIWWPPNGFNCRCSTIEIFNEDKQADQVDPPDRLATPDEGWSFNPGLLFADQLAM